MRLISLPLLLAVFSVVTWASAEEIRVKATVSSTVLADAVAVAEAGDTVILEAGIYREAVKLSKAIILRGEPGAILEGSDPLKADWQPVAGMNDVFSVELKKQPEGLLAAGAFIAEIRWDRAQKAGEWHWQTLLEKGTPLSGFKQVQALWMYHPQEKRAYLRWKEGASPAQAELAVVRSNKPLIEIGASGVVVEGLTFQGGKTAIELGKGAKDCVVRKCRVDSYEDTGILITDGASQCTVENCALTRGALEDWRATNEIRRENYEIWRLHKDVGKYDRVGIDLIEPGVANRILNNRFDRVFDGICLGDYRAESLDKPLPDAESGRGTEIAYNVIENTRDSGIELGTGCIEVNVHHNTLRHTHGGFRFKVPRIGPVFVHHNHLIEGTPFNLWFSMDSSPAEGYIYHNTFEGGDDAAIVYSSFNAMRNFATPKWHVLNNLALNVRDGFFEQRKGTPPRDFTESNNLITKDASAAEDKGLDLSTYRNGKPLPGCEKGYYHGRAPDVGAAEKGR
ncbi:Right handed beta helix region [Prosthecobacter debontii]|uniref:Right handed beta helix region n=1 Tax=Prosthecobacter debontii TaxID=48467 RepID=A0A1T4XF03_9BACT|nr:right-handed parallel beta-helix repeat-containing protein [Prosthecobacter debontii]SKA88164.1 Right handed beta helix region [Prosthecobacter debontii]